MWAAWHWGLVQFTTYHFQLTAISKTVNSRQPRAVVGTTSLHVAHQHSNISWYQWIPTTTCLAAHYLGWPGWDCTRRKTFIHSQPVLQFIIPFRLLHNKIKLPAVYSIFLTQLSRVVIFFCNLTPSYPWPTSTFYAFHFITHTVFHPIILILS